MCIESFVMVVLPRYQKILASAFMIIKKLILKCFGRTFKTESLVGKKVVGLSTCTILKGI